MANWRLLSQNCNKPYLKAGANVNTTNGRLTNTGTATNVQLQIRNPVGTVVGASKASGAQNALMVTVASHASTMRYAANYYAACATAAGSVVSAVTYSVVYNQSDRMREEQRSAGSAALSHQSLSALAYSFRLVPIGS